MPSKFTRRFDPQKPRNRAAEEFDTHQVFSKGPIPRLPPWSVVVLPEGRPHSLYHGRRDCKALTADVSLAAQCEQDVKPQVVKLDDVRGRDDRTGCPVCRPTETDFTKIKGCLRDTETGRQKGLRLLWRQDPGAGWYAVVSYDLRPGLGAEIRSEEELRELPDPA